MSFVSQAVGLDYCFMSLPAEIYYSDFIIQIRATHRCILATDTACVRQKTPTVSPFSIESKNSVLPEREGGSLKNSAFLHMLP